MLQIVLDNRQGIKDLGDSILQFFLQREASQAQAEQLKNQKAAQELDEKKFGLDLKKFLATKATAQLEAADRQGAINEINAPTSPGALLAATDVLDVPSTEVNRLRRTAFPTTVEKGVDTIALANTGMALELLQHPRSGEELVQLVVQNPAIGGALKILGADATVKDLLNDLQTRQGEVRRSRIALKSYADKKGIEIAADAGLAGVADARAIGAAILDPSKTAELPPAALEALGQARLIAQSAALNTIRESPTIRILLALQATALRGDKDGKNIKEDRAFAIQDLINTEMTRLLGPDVATLLPEFVKVPGRDGVTDKGRSLITDPNELIAVNFLFDTHDGNLDVAIRQTQALIDTRDPNDPLAVEAVAIMGFLQEFKGNPNWFKRVLRGLRNIVVGKPPVKR